MPPVCISHEQNWVVFKELSRFEFSQKIGIISLRAPKSFCDTSFLTHFQTCKIKLMDFAFGWNYSNLKIQICISQSKAPGPIKSGFWYWRVNYTCAKCVLNVLIKSSLSIRTESFYSDIFLLWGLMHRLFRQVSLTTGSSSSAFLNSTFPKEPVDGMMTSNLEFWVSRELEDAKRNTRKKL